MVMGYFLVAGHTSKRIFVDKPLLDFHYLRECALVTEDLGTMFLLLRHEWPLYLTQTVNDQGFLILGLPSRKRCTDCTADGGVLEEPDFWIE